MPKDPPTQTTKDLLADYLRLVNKVDAHAARVEREHADQLACRAGCTGCCHRELTVFPVEAASIRQWLDERELPAVPVPLPATSVLEILELGTRPTPCAMLDGAGRCRIYPVRPLICRTHGLPLAVQDDDGLYADVCPLSFDGGSGLAELEERDFMVIDTLNTILAAVDSAYVQVTGVNPDRVALRALARPSTYEPVL
jgi:Fe-S-cluster containining protein